MTDLTELSNKNIDTRGGTRDQIDSGPGADAQGHTPPTEPIIRANAEFGEELPLTNRQDFKTRNRASSASFEFAEGSTVCATATRQRIKEETGW